MHLDQITCCAFVSLLEFGSQNVEGRLVSLAAFRALLLENDSDRLGAPFLRGDADEAQTAGKKLVSPTIQRTR